MSFFVSSAVVFPGLEQLPSAAQTAADWNSSAEQPGRAFPPAQLPHAGEVQVGSRLQVYEHLEFLQV